MAEVGDPSQDSSNFVDPMIGRIIDGRYLLELKLGQGGMGRVYQARQVRMDRLVAVKIVHAEHSSDPDLRARFVREAVALARVSHPYVLLAHDNGITEDGLLYLVTELLEGHPLDRLVAASPQGRLPLAPAITILRQLAVALEAVHPHLIHRDLKPQNVMVQTGPQGVTVKLLDFGIVRPNTGSELTGTGIIGTPTYMSPEQITQQPDLDPRSDLYSLGIIAYELMTGTAPFRSERYFEVLSAHLSETPAPVLEARDEDRLPSALTDLIARLLAKDPAQRPSTAAEVRAALEMIDAEVDGPRTLPSELMEAATPALPTPPPGAARSSGAPAATHSSWASSASGGERPLMPPQPSLRQRVFEDRRLVPILLVLLVLVAGWGLAQRPRSQAEPIDTPGRALAPGAEVPSAGSVVTAAIPSSPEPTDAGLSASGASPTPRRSPKAPVPRDVPPSAPKPVAPPTARTTGPKSLRPRRGSEGESNRDPSDNDVRPRARSGGESESVPSGGGWRPPRGMAAVSAGAFLMGCNSAVDRECRRNEGQARSVTLEGFALDLREVTVADYQACRAVGRCPKPSGGRYCNWGVQGREDHPMNCVNWREARAFCAWRGKRLPTEAEWEKAARGSSGQKYPWGSAAVSCRYAVLDDGRTTGTAGRDTDGCGSNSTRAVASKPAGRSPYGHFDMIGNVQEWTLDKVAKGCGWTESPRECRASYREPTSRKTRRYQLGFRCAKSPPS